NSGAGGAAGSRLVVNRRRQEGNPVLKYVRNVRYEWGDIGTDFECGPTCGVLYLALKYHKLHPNYILTRLSGKDENKYACRVEEAAEYIENFKLADSRDPAFKKPAASVPVDERTALQNAAIGILTGARSVTKTDAQ
ncbi:DNA repair protein rad10, partial [Ancylostoma duodenale]